jgi:hypothetical protein
MLALIVLVLVLGSVFGFLHAGFGGKPTAAVVVSVSVSPSPSPSPSPVAAVPVSAPTDTPTPEATDTSDVSAPASTDLPDNVTLRRTTGKSPIVLRPDYGMDLDDDVDTSSNWGVSDGNSYSGVYLDEGQHAIDFSRDWAPETGSAGYNTCANETAYTEGEEPLARAHKGNEFCIRTPDSRYALIQIVSASNTSLSFTATVWDPPFQQ